MFFGLGAAVFGLIGKLRARRKSFPRRKYRCLLFCSCLACITLVRSRRLRGVGHGKVGGIIGTVVSWPTLGRVGQPLEFERIDEIRVEIQSIGDSDLKQAFGTLLNLVEHLAEENQGLGDEHQRLRDEIARLKGFNEQTIRLTRQLRVPQDLTQLLPSLFTSDRDYSQDEVDKELSALFPDKLCKRRKSSLSTSTPRSLTGSVAGCNYHRWPN